LFLVYLLSKEDGAAKRGKIPSTMIPKIPEGAREIFIAANPSRLFDIGGGGM
jgi:hypothetical protein